MATESENNLFELINLNIAAYGGGITGELLLDAKAYFDGASSVRGYISASDDNQNTFFRPITSSDAYRVVTPFIAPVALSLVAVGAILYCAANLLGVVVSIFSLDGEGVKEHFLEAVTSLAAAVGLILAAVVSPVVNLVDVVGGLVNTVIDPAPEDDYSDLPRFTFNN